jgi:hypothetical protein
MATTPEQIVNQAVMLARRTRRIADMFEGSEEAIVALELYGQTRDELLRERDWSFSRRITSLTLLKGPPPAGGYNPRQPWSSIYPRPGYLYEYAYPSDCLDVRAIYPPPGGMPDLDPRQAEWSVDDDPTPVVADGEATGPEAKVIYCNVTNAMLTYRGQVTNPVLFDALFTKTLVFALADKFAMAFGESEQVVQHADAEAMGVEREAGMVRG